MGAAVTLTRFLTRSHAASHGRNACSDDFGWSRRPFASQVLAVSACPPVVVCAFSGFIWAAGQQEHGRDASDGDRPQTLIVCALLTARQCTITYSLSRVCWHVVVHKHKPHQIAMKRARSDAASTQVPRYSWQGAQSLLHASSGRWPRQPHIQAVLFIALLGRRRLYVPQIQGVIHFGSGHTPSQRRGNVNRRISHFPESSCCTDRACGVDSTAGEGPHGEDANGNSQANSQRCSILGGATPVHCRCKHGVHQDESRREFEQKRLHWVRIYQFAGGGERCLEECGGKADTQQDTTNTLRALEPRYTA